MLLVELISWRISNFKNDATHIEYFSMVIDRLNEKKIRYFWSVWWISISKVSIKKRKLSEKKEPMIKLEQTSFYDRNHKMNLKNAMLSTFLFGKIYLIVKAIFLNKCTKTRGGLITKLFFLLWSFPFFSIRNHFVFILFTCLINLVPRTTCEM